MYMTTNVSEKRLKNIIKQSVKEAVGTEFMKFRVLMVPEVSEKEQKDIEKRYRRPSGKNGRSFAFKI